MFPLSVYELNLYLRNAAEKRAEESKETSLVLADQDHSQSQKHLVAEKVPMDDHPSLETEAKKTKSDESGSDVSKGRPMSPSTLALMCDEGDTMFTAAASSNGLVDRNNNNVSAELLDEQGVTEAYTEQERIVLTKFRDCLNRLITLGEIKGKFLSSLLYFFYMQKHQLEENLHCYS